MWKEILLFSIYMMQHQWLYASREKIVPNNNWNYLKHRLHNFLMLKSPSHHFFRGEPIDSPFYRCPIQSSILLKMGNHPLDIFKSAIIKLYPEVFCLFVSNCCTTTGPPRMFLNTVKEDKIRTLENQFGISMLYLNVVIIYHIILVDWV